MIPVPLKIERTDAEGGKFGLSVSLVIDGQQMLVEIPYSELGEFRQGEKYVIGKRNRNHQYTAYIRFVITQCMR